MKVLLVSDVKKLGWLGDVVEVTDGYARNYLFPQGFAKLATDPNVKAIARAKAQRAEQRKLERQQLEKVCQAVNGAEVVIAAAANEQGHLFGSVFRHEIADNLRAQGFEVADDTVELTEHIKQVGTYRVGLWFDNDLKAAVSVVVVPEGADVEAFKAAQKEAAKKEKEQSAEQPEEDSAAPVEPRPENDEKASAQ
ncbi:MAG: 50S ribosomal protein L9 [Sedimentisphaerales bacterium]|jgi:large subunit ribosomal protein L9